MKSADPNQPLALLGGLSPARFMRRHWQRQPLLVRQAIAGVVPPLSRAELFALAARDDVESRLVVQEAQGPGRPASWRVRHGPLARRARPALRRPGWTLLVQGADLHVPAAHDLLARFRFLPAARLDDVMVSFASEGGGVGPHVDSYDVFLLQVHGRRRWRVAPPGDERFVDGLPLKILARFRPTMDWVLEPGDMLYLPPGWGHDGVAASASCMTCSVGFRSPLEHEVARELLQRLSELAEEPGASVASAGGARRYGDAGSAPVQQPARVPAGLQRFAESAVRRALRRPEAIGQVLGEWLTEPKPQVWFDGGAGDGAGARAAGGVRLHARSRMLYDARHLYLNGESWRIAGRDATLLRRLADEGMLAASDVRRLSPDARDALQRWLSDGWLAEHPA